MRPKSLRVIESVEYSERIIMLKERKNEKGEKEFSWMDGDKNVSQIFTSLEEAQDYMGAKSTIHRIIDETSA